MSTLGVQSSSAALALVRLPHQQRDCKCLRGRLRGFTSLIKATCAGNEGNVWKPGVSEARQCLRNISLGVEGDVDPDLKRVQETGSHVV